MKFKLVTAMSVCLITATAYATDINLVNATPEAGQMVVQYEFLNAKGEPNSMIASTILPAKVSLPNAASGVRVLTIQNASLPNDKMPGGWFNFPGQGCYWTNNSGQAPMISFSITAHSISCQ